MGTPQNFPKKLLQFERPLALLNRVVSLLLQSILCLVKTPYIHPKTYI